MFQHFRNTASFSSVKPEFETDGSSLNITAVIGQTTHLPCTVRTIGDRTVRHAREWTTCPGRLSRQGMDDLSRQNVIKHIHDWDTAAKGRYVTAGNGRHVTAGCHSRYVTGALQLQDGRSQQRQDNLGHGMYRTVRHGRDRTV